MKNLQICRAGVAKLFKSARSAPVPAKSVAFCKHARCRSCALLPHEQASDQRFTTDGDPDARTIQGGRPYLNGLAKVGEMFNAHALALITQATTSWPKIRVRDHATIRPGRSCAALRKTARTCWPCRGAGQAGSDKSKPQAAPVAATHDDRGRHIFHDLEDATAHVAAIDL